MRVGVGEAVGVGYFSVVCMSAERFGGLVQDCNESITNALELLLSCTKPSISVSLPIVLLLANRCIPRRGSPRLFGGLQTGLLLVDDDANHI